MLLITHNVARYSQCCSLLAMLFITHNVHITGGLECSDHLSEDLKITSLMAEYAERDEHYEGRVLDDSSPCDGPPRPVLMCVQTISQALLKGGGVQKYMTQFDILWGGPPF